MKHSTPPKAVTGFRLPPEDLDMLDAYAAKLAAERPGLRVTRTDALTILYRAGMRALGITPTSTTSTDTPDAAQG